MLFNNVTVVCQSKISFSSNKAHDVFFVKKHFIDLQYLDQIGMKSFVNFLQGQVTKIDRKEKKLIINDKNQLKYDYLFMMFGEMFHKPLKYYRQHFKETPDNVFIVNTYIDVNKALLQLKYLLNRNQGSDCKIVKHFLYQILTFLFILQKQTLQYVSK